MPPTFKTPSILIVDGEFVANNDPVIINVPPISTVSELLYPNVRLPFIVKIVPDVTRIELPFLTIKLPEVLLCDTTTCWVPFHITRLGILEGIQPLAVFQLVVELFETGLATTQLATNMNTRVNGYEDILFTIELSNLIFN